MQVITEESEVTLTKQAKRNANGIGNIRKRADGRWEARYCVGFDPKTGDITLMCPTPEWKDDVDESANVVLRTSTPAVRPDGSMFAVLYAFHNRVIIFDAQGNVLKELSLPMEGVQDKFDSPVFYRWVVAFNDELIVAQYGVNEYHFLDWNGRMKKRIVTDRKVVNPAFDFDTNTFYGLDLEEEVTKLYSASIKF